MSGEKSKPTTQTCERHRDEPIMVFSLKHEKAMCLKCAMLEHDQISDFIPVSEGARMMKAQGNKLLEEIKSTENAIKHIKLEKNKYLEKLRESERLVKEGIKSLRDKINKLLNTLESKVVGQLKHIVKSKEESFAKFKKDIYKIEDELKNMNDNVRSSLKTGNELAMIATVVKEKNTFQITKAQVQEKRVRGQTDKIHFRQSAIMTSFLENAKSLGEISCVDSVQAFSQETVEVSKTPLPNNVPRNRTPGNTSITSNYKPSLGIRDNMSNSESPIGSTRSERLARFSRFRHSNEVQLTPVINLQAQRNYHGDHNRQTARDNNSIVTAEHDGPCNHTGIAALSNGYVVVCDARHKCIQLISRDSKLLDDVIFHCKPCDVTSMSENGIAVSFHDKDYITLFKVSNRRFVHVRDLSVGGRGGSYSIAHARNRFAICRRGEIRIISDEDGALRNVIQIEAHYPQIVLGETESRIYLSDFVGGKVVCSTEAGQPRWEYSRESLEPTGIAIDLNQLYVTDINGKILVLSTYGLLVREIECDGQLNALSVDQNTGTLLVTQESKDKRKSRIVKIVSV